MQLCKIDLHKGKKLLGIALTALCFVTPSLASAMQTLNDSEISEAKRRANKIVPQRKINFVFRSESESDELREAHFLYGDKYASVHAYWLTPFTVVMNEQIEQTRTGDRDFNAFVGAATRCQLRLLFDIQSFHKERFLVSDILVTQGRTTIVPLFVRYAPLQHAVDSVLGERTIRQRVGVVLDFDAADIAPNLPIHVAVKGDGGTPLILEALQNEGEYNEYETKSHAFRWYPLHDTL